MSDEIKELLKEASMAYYMGEPIMSDAEFDILASSVRFTDVGYSSNENRVAHVHRMYSLQKVFENEHEEKNPLKLYTGLILGNLGFDVSNI